MIQSATDSYFVLWFRLDDKNAYLLWFSGDRDGVVVEGDRLAAFVELDTLKAYTELHRLNLIAETPILHDLDGIQKWLLNPLAATIDCDNFISAWNLFDDVSASLRLRFEPMDERIPHLYDSLFYGLNLPAMTAAGEQYQPIWLEADVELLKEVLRRGLILFREGLQFFVPARRM